MKLGRAVPITVGAASVAAGAPMLRPNGRQSHAEPKRAGSHHASRSAPCLEANAFA
jgi:hypothetical protein